MKIFPETSFDFYVIDRDFEPKPGANIRACSLYPQGKKVTAIKRAVSDLDLNATEGQSIVRHCGTDECVGYAIKYTGQPAFFEAA